MPRMTLRAATVGIEGDARVALSSGPDRLRSRRKQAILAMVLACIATLALVSHAEAAETYSWGSYIAGEQGIRMSPFASGLSGVTAIDAGNSSSYALKSDGTVWAWGNNQDGQLGNGTLVGSFTVPVRVQIPAVVVAIGEARNEAFAIDSTGRGWVWGANGLGSLCVSGQDISTPVLNGITKAVQVQGGQSHVLWLLSNGTVLGCGNNEEGQLGIGETPEWTKTPVAIPGLSGIVAVSTGNRVSAALDNKGRLYMFGANSNGQVGIGSKEPEIDSPALVPLPAVREVSVGGDVVHNGATLALTTTGEVYGWGSDEQGQIGDRSTTMKLSPVDTGLSFSKIVTGGTFSMGLDGEGNLWAWGSNIGGDLGIGRASGDYPTPQLVQGGVKMMSATARNAESLTK